MSGCCALTSKDVWNERHEDEELQGSQRSTLVRILLLHGFKWLAAFRDE